MEETMRLMFRARHDPAGSCRALLSAGLSFGVSLRAAEGEADHGAGLKAAQRGFGEPDESREVRHSFR